MMSLTFQIVNRPMKIQTDVADVMVETNVGSQRSLNPDLNLNSDLNLRFVAFTHKNINSRDVSTENGNYPNNAASGPTNNNGTNNTPTPASVDVNANEKSSTQQSQQNPSSQQAAPAAAANTTTNSSSNGPPPKGQRERGNRGGGGGMRNKKMNPTSESKPSSEKIVNGSS